MSGWTGSPAGSRLLTDKESGFTLLEVIVAFIIAAIALAVLFQGGVAGIRSARIAASYEQAVARANSRLAAASLAASLRPSDQQGDDGGGFHWRTRVSLIGTAARQSPGVLGLAARASSTVSLFAISVEISWRGDGGERRVSLRTDRLGPAAGVGP